MNNNKKLIAMVTLFAAIQISMFAFAPSAEASRYTCNWTTIEGEILVTNLRDPVSRSNLNTDFLTHTNTSNLGIFSTMMLPDGTSVQSRFIAGNPIIHQIVTGNCRNLQGLI